MPLTLARHTPQKPRVGPLQLVQGHPLVPGLVFAAPLHESGSDTPVDYVTGAAPSAQVMAWTGTQHGHAPNFNGSTRYVRYADNALWRPGSSAFTVIVLANPIAGASTIGLFSKRNGTNFDQLSLLANVNSNGGSQSGSFGFYFYDVSSTLSACTTSTSQVDGTFHQFALTRVGSSASLYRDGVSQAATFSNTGNPNWTGTPSLYLGALGNTNGVPAGGFLNGQIIYAYYWVGRALSAGEIQSVLAEPYQMFQARPIQRWFVITAGGATYPVTVTATQAQAVTLPKQANLVRALGQAQVLSLVKQASLLRSVTQPQAATTSALKVLLRTVNATQTQAAVLVKQAGLVRSLTQAQAVALTRQTSLTRTVTQAQSASVQKQANLVRPVGQSQAASVSVLKVLIRIVSATQAQAVSLVKQVALRRTVSQAQQLTLQRVVSLVRAAVQPESATVTVGFISGGVIVPAAILVVVQRTRALVVSARTRILEAVNR